MTPEQRIADSADLIYDALKELGWDNYRAYDAATLAIPELTKLYLKGQ